jgi:hypothetical protein
VGLKHQHTIIAAAAAAAATISLIISLWCCVVDVPQRNL